MPQIQVKALLVRVSGEFELPMVQVIGVHNSMYLLLPSFHCKKQKRLGRLFHKSRIRRWSYYVWGGGSKLQ